MLLRWFFPPNKFMHLVFSSFQFSFFLCCFWEPSCYGRINDKHSAQNQMCAFNTKGMDGRMDGRMNTPPLQHSSKPRE